MSAAERFAREEQVLDLLIAKVKARKASILTFAERNAGRTFEGVAGEKSGCMRVIVSPSLERKGGWRLTRFDLWEGAEEACGHTELVLYEDAVELAVVDYGVDLTKVVFA